jgi:hypothetical protein
MLAAAASLSVSMSGIPKTLRLKAPRQASGLFEAPCDFEGRLLARSPSAKSLGRASLAPRLFFDLRSQSELRSLEGHSERSSRGLCVRPCKTLAPFQLSLARALRDFRGACETCGHRYLTRRAALLLGRRDLHLLTETPARQCTLDRLPCGQSGQGFAKSRRRPFFDLRSQSELRSL